MRQVSVFFCNWLLLLFIAAFFFFSFFFFLFVGLEEWGLYLCSPIHLESRVGLQRWKQTRTLDGVGT
jgi:hypothetical protein